MLLSKYLPWILGICLAGIFIGFLAAARYAREAKISQFYFIREQARVKAGRVMIVVGFLGVVTIALAILVIISNTLSNTLTPVVQVSPTPALTPTPELSPTMPATVVATAVPTPVLTPTTPSPTATASPSPTIIPTPSSTLTPIVGAETPLPGATFGEITMARGVTEDNKPKNPGTVFPAGILQLYAFFDYQNLSNGVLWTQVWYRKGKEIGSESSLWEWGSYGTAWIFLKPVGGYPRGEYEVRLYIGDELKQTATFTVR